MSLQSVSAKRATGASTLERRQTLTTELFLEDLTLGQKFGSSTFTVDGEAIRRFAREFDPQPFHLDDAAARASLFKGLAASGWHTSAITMRLLVGGEMRPAGGIIGAGMEDLKWPTPVRPGDVLRVESEVVDIRASRSRPERGIAKMRVVTSNQRGEAVQTVVATLVMQARPQRPSEPVFE